MEEKKQLSAAELLSIIRRNPQFSKQAQALAVHRLTLDLPEQVAPTDIQNGYPENLFKLLNAEFAQKDNERRAFIIKHKDKDWCWEYVFYNASLNDSVCFSLLQEIEPLDFLEKASVSRNMSHVIKNLALTQKFEAVFEQNRQMAKIGLEAIKEYIDNIHSDISDEQIQIVKILYALLIKSFADCLNAPVNTKRIIAILKLLDNFKAYIADNKYIRCDNEKFAEEMEKLVSRGTLKLYRLSLSCENLRIADVMEVYKELSFFIFPRTAKMVLLRVAAKTPDFLTMQEQFFSALSDAEHPFYVYSKYQVVVYHYHNITILTYLMRKYNQNHLGLVLWSIWNSMWYSENKFEEWPVWGEQRHKAVLKGLRALLNTKDDADLQKLCTHYLVKLIDVLALSQNGFVEKAPDLSGWLLSRKIPFTAMACSLLNKLETIVCKLPPVDFYTIKEFKEQWHAAGETIPQWERSFLERKDISDSLNKLFYDALRHWLAVIDVEAMISTHDLEWLMHYQSSFKLPTEKAEKRIVFLKQEAERKEEEEKKKREQEGQELAALLSF